MSNYHSFADYKDLEPFHSGTYNLRWPSANPPLPSHFYRYPHPFYFFNFFFGSPQDQGFDDKQYTLQDCCVFILFF